MLQPVVEASLLLALYLADRPAADTRRGARALWWTGVVGALALIVTAPL